MKKFRRYNVFISSTFRDMDFERDILKFKVIPRINTELKNYNVELTAIDLRVVLFPAPFEPIRVTISPFGTSIDIPLTACIPP